MKITLTQLREIYRDLPAPRHAGECRFVSLPRDPDTRVCPHVSPIEEDINEILFKSVAFYRPWDRDYQYRWVLETPLKIILDRW